MRTRLNFRQLETFRAVVIGGGFTQAARLLHISQPAVSKTISDLEKELGVNLFERSGSSINPTKEAELIFAEFQKIYTGLDRLTDIANLAASGLVGSVQCGALPVYAEAVLPEIIDTFAQDNNDVVVTVDSMRHDELMSAVLTGEIDVALTSLPTLLDTISEHTTATEPAILLAPPNSKFSTASAISINELKDEPYIAYPSSCPFGWSLAHYFSANNFVPKIKAVARSPGVVCRLVERGMGVAIVQQCAADIYAGGAHSLRLEEPCNWRYGFVTKKNSSHSTSVLSFLQHVSRLPSAH